MRGKAQRTRPAGWLQIYLPALPWVATMEEKNTKWSRCLSLRDAASRFQLPMALGLTHLFHASPVCSKRNL